MKLPLLCTEGAPLDFIEWGTLLRATSIYCDSRFLTMIDACVAEVCENNGTQKGEES